MLIIGIPLGILIGIITGIFLILLVQQSRRELSTKQILSLAAEILGIPAFWFGGSWVTTPWLESVDFNEMLPAYILSLASTWVPIGLFVLYRLIIKSGNERGEVKEVSGD